MRQTVKMGEELAESIPKIDIGATQAAFEQTPKDTIPLPIDRGSIDVHDDVVKGGVAPRAPARTRQRLIAIHSVACNWVDPPRRPAL